MSDEKKDTTEESEELEETSNPAQEAGDETSEPKGQTAESMDREPEEPPPTLTTEKDEIITEELGRDDIETVDTDRDEPGAVVHDTHHHGPTDVLGVAAFFDHPDHLLYAATQTRDAEYADFDAYSPFPIHGMDDAMGLGRSWIPWVTFLAGSTGFLTASMIEFGIMGFDWPMIFGGKPFIAWPSFVPVMFELTVLFAGVTTAIVMLAAAGCFRKPLIIDPEITNDRFVLWISANDPRFSAENVVEFMRGLNPMEIRTLKKDASK